MAVAQISVMNVSVQRSEGERQNNWAAHFISFENYVCTVPAFVFVRSPEIIRKKM